MTERTAVVVVADLALIRRDQHSAWRGHAVPDPAAVLTRTVGA